MNNPFVLLILFFALFLSSCTTGKKMPVSSGEEQIPPACYRAAANYSDSLIISDVYQKILFYFREKHSSRYPVLLRYLQDGKPFSEFICRETKPTFFETWGEMAEFYQQRASRSNAFTRDSTRHLVLFYPQGMYSPDQLTALKYALEYGFNAIEQTFRFETEKTVRYIGSRIILPVEHSARRDTFDIVGKIPLVLIRHREDLQHIAGVASSLDEHTGGATTLAFNIPQPVIAGKDTCYFKINVVSLANGFLYLPFITHELTHALFYLNYAAFADLEDSLRTAASAGINLTPEHFFRLYQQWVPTLQVSWIEGIAYYATFQMDILQRLHILPEVREVIAELYEKDKIIPVMDVVNSEIHYNWWEKMLSVFGFRPSHKYLAFYLEGGGMTDFILQEFGADAYRQVIGALKARPGFAGVKSVLGVDEETFLKKWRAYSKPATNR